MSNSQDLYVVYGGGDTYIYVTLPADTPVVLVLTPADGRLTHSGTQAFVNSAYDFRQGALSIDPIYADIEVRELIVKTIPPRISRGDE